ncbi:murein biosynthesis integral membrane protein MurJ [Brevibacterium jeotgali]|uniref:Putative peptidoglycan lipid II flippase n=1 Tax=Brevibacterium jeotgali TaxID=1262550 RepID=A0A2H1L6V4_9MICO|nr:lipid II flippase MurJ [Brevibacterium jeotgali]TWC02595.1 putative peptidoglycan lipid II flippase [Brevibacterium jeotgali]SMY12505.1 putative peptidoglycan lipid II flippase [Brevibacterium jeotgali]
MPRLLRFVASAALLVSVATLLSRLVGFGRLLVFSPSVGAGAIGTAYQSANQVPNILYEVIAGGALAGAVVPLLAGPLARADTATASRIASALLTWSVSLTLPLAVLIVVFREQIAGAVLDHESEVAYGAGFLLMFAPQLVLYAIGGVLTGVLQAHRRFLWPAFMPLVSSLIVIGVYVGYARLRGPEVATEDPAALALLGWGTTAGVVALALPLALPTLRTGLRIRSAWRFPAGVAARAVRLAAAGMTVLLAQQAATLMIMVVSNNVGGTGVFVVFSYIQAVYLLPYAVLAIPVATVAFPRLSELAASARTRSTEPSLPEDVDAAIAKTSRLVLALGFAGAALLIAAATPLEDFFSTRDAASGDSPELFAALGDAVRVIAWAVPGWCFVAWGTRVFYALERSRTAAIATAVGWSAVALSVVAGIPLVGEDPAPRTLVLLGAAHVIGMTLAAAGLIGGILRVRGRASAAGIPRTLVVASVGAVLGAAVGSLTASSLGTVVGTSSAAAVAAGATGGTAALVVVLAVVALADRGTLAHVRGLR